MEIAKFFLPDKETGRLPLFLSSFSFTLFGVLATVLLLFPATVRERNVALLLGAPTFNNEDVIRLVNASRAEAGLSSLKENDLLSASAKAKAEDMAVKGYFSHTSPDGKTPWDFIRGTGYKYTAAGENLALDYVTAEDAEKALMASPTHRANILNKLYTEIGVSVVSGEYEGRSAVYLVQHFGKPVAGLVQAPKIEDLAAAKDIVKTPLAEKPPVKTAQKVAVLGTETPKETKPATNASKPSWVDEPVTGPSVPIRFVGFLVVFILLTALSLALLRLGALPFQVMVQTFVLILIFGYIATHNVILRESPPSITPISFSTSASIPK